MSCYQGFALVIFLVGLAGNSLSFLNSLKQLDPKMILHHEFMIRMFVHASSAKFSIQCLQRFFWCMYHGGPNTMKCMFGAPYDNIHELLVSAFSSMVLIYLGP